MFFQNPITKSNLECSFSVKQHKMIRMGRKESSPTLQLNSDLESQNILNAYKVNKSKIYKHSFDFRDQSSYAGRYCSGKISLFTITDLITLTKHFYNVCQRLQFCWFFIAIIGISLLLQLSFSVSLQFKFHS